MPLIASFLAISIHTPMKGVTKWYSITIGGYTDFNPHSHEGSDAYWSQWNLMTGYFNPHSHEGSDRSSCMLLPSRQEFQSTLP